MRHAENGEIRRKNKIDRSPLPHTIFTLIMTKKGFIRITPIIPSKTLFILSMHPTTQDFDERSQ